MKRPAGRPYKNTAQQIRCMAFACSLRNISGMSFNHLDQVFVAERPDQPFEKQVGQLHLFYRVRNEGRDPDTQAAIAQRGFSVIKRIAAVDHLKKSVEVYQSPFWQFINNPSNDVTILLLFTELILSEDVIQIPEDTIPVTETILNANLSEKSDYSKHYQQVIETVAKQGSFDNLTFLILLYMQIRVLFHQKTHTCFLLEQIYRCLINCVDYYQFDDEIGNHLYWLITVRIIENSWGLNKIQFAELVGYTHLHTDKKALKFWLDSTFDQIDL